MRLVWNQICVIDIENRTYWKAKNSIWQQNIPKILEEKSYKFTELYNKLGIGETDSKSLLKRIITEGIAETRKTGKNNTVYTDKV